MTDVPLPPPPARPEPAKKRGCLRWVLIGLGVFILLGIIGAALGGGDEQPEASATTTTTEVSASTTPADDTTTTVEPAETTTTGREATIEDDVVVLSCNPSSFGTMAAQLEVTNNSSDRSNYSIEVAFTSADGAEQFDTGYASVSGLESGQRATEEAASLEDVPPGGYQCAVQDVTRFSDEP